MNPPTSGGPDPIGAVVERLDYPMYVVTAAAGGHASGCLAGFVTQCSIDPPRFLVCVSVVNHTAWVAGRSDALGVHLLGSDQHGTARLFGELTGDTIDKLSMVRWRPGSTGAPVIEECAAWFEGRVLGRFDLGDHLGHLVEPVTGGAGGHEGWLPYSAVSDLSPGHPAQG